MESLVQYLVDRANGRLAGVTGPLRPRLESFAFEGSQFCQRCRQSQDYGAALRGEFARLMIVAHDLGLFGG